MTSLSMATIEEGYSHSSVNVVAIIGNNDHIVKALIIIIRNHITLSGIGTGSRYNTKY